MKTASPKTPAVRLAAGATAAMLALSGCGADEPEVVEDTGAEPEEQDTDEVDEQAAEAEDGEDGDGVGVEGTALDFETSTLGGQDYAGASLAGEPAVMWFWAPWCTVCRSEAPDVSAASERHEGDVEFIGVAGLGEVDEMDAFVSETGIEDMTHIVDEDGDIWSGFGVTAQPAFSFVRPDGTHLTVAGTLGAEELDSLIAEEILQGGEG